MTPQPTDKLDATAYVVVNGPADDALFNDERIVRPHATGSTAACLSRVLANGHALVLRGARHSNVSGLPVQSTTLGAAGSLPGSGIRAVWGGVVARRNWRQRCHPCSSERRVVKAPCPPPSAELSVSGAHPNPGAGVVHVALRVPQRRVLLRLGGGRGVPGADEDLVLSGRELNRDPPVPPSPPA